MIGIDLGTTQSKAAYIDPTGKPCIIPNDRTHHQTPSVLYYPPSGDPLVGVDAVEQGYVDPTRCLRNFKLKLGGRENLLGEGPVTDPTDATAAMVAYLKRCAEQAVGKEVTECVATCPANFRDDAKQALQEAFERNGVKVLKLVPEPTAAGYAYALENLGKDVTFQVYDFGGGTFDASVVRVQGSQVTVLATDGIPELGGNDLNEPIRQRLLAEIGNAFGEIPDRASNGLFFQDLDAKVEAAKISLGTRPQVPCVLGYKGSQVVVELTADLYHASIEEMVHRSLEAMDRTVQGAGLSYQEIDHLLLVGGTSRMPYIQETVARHTGLTPKADIEPEKAVAYGAALACVSELAKDGRTATVRGHVIPAPEMFVRDVTAHSVGCCVVDGSSAAKRLVNSEIIPKNTPIPCQKTDRFFLEHEDQTKARIEILQGKADADRDDCLVVGELVLENLPKEAKRTERLQLDYVIDVNGMVTVTAIDKASGKQQSVSVDYKKGIKPKDQPSAA